MGETRADNQRDALFISTAAAAAACLAMRSIACWRVAACWSVSGASGMGGIGGKTVGVVVEEVDGKSGCGAGQGGLVGREQGLSCAVCGGVEVVFDVAGEIER